jgi:DNA-binding transcriptional ArsR family regulator
MVAAHGAALEREGKTIAMAVGSKGGNGADEMAAMMESAVEASDFLKAMANENRLLLLCLLADGEKSVTELENTLALRQPTVSQQLARLRADNLVSYRRDGKTIYYSLASDEARHVIDLVYELFCAPKSKRSKGEAAGVDAAAV